MGTGPWHHGAVTLPPHELRRLRAAASGRSQASLVAAPALGEAEQRDLDALVERRLTGEPLQYLEGTVPFGPIEVMVDTRALIPRPETEQVWETAVARLGRAGPGTAIVDVGTGSGVLALALEHAFGSAAIFATDASADALALASANGTRLGSRVEFLHGDLLDPLPQRLRGRVDLIVSNPPYVSEAEFSDLPPEVRDHEPRDALVAGPAGTEILERLAHEAYWWLGVGGWVVCEIGETQGPAVLDLFGAYDREVIRDLTGRDRILVARKGAPCCV
jgi:release factor glutamine methyltransferase